MLPEKLGRGETEKPVAAPHATADCLPAIPPIIPKAGQRYFGYATPGKRNCCLNACWRESKMPGKSGFAHGSEAVRCGVGALSEAEGGAGGIPACPPSILCSGLR